MYCLGTGDCFLVKFCSGDTPVFTMMIDCGSCRGNQTDFLPYLTDLSASLPNKTIDLLVVTHEHNDHVNGFDKCIDIFKELTIHEAWFAWTEKPGDPGGAAAALKTKQKKMKMALRNAINAVTANQKAFAGNKQPNAYRNPLVDNQAAFLNGLHTLAEINLADTGDEDLAGSLPGMHKIKQLLTAQGTKVRYLSPGDTVNLPELPGLNFYVLGPPSDQEHVYKDGRQGTDVYNKSFAINESSLAVNALIGMADATTKKDLPFSSSYVLEGITPGATTAKEEPLAKVDLSTRVNPLTKADPTMKDKSQYVIDAYDDPKNDWRKIDDDWLNGAGALALRLNSHINNTSLVLAIEFPETKKVVLFPGDAEYGSWESWHLISQWLEKGADKKPWAQDLLRRTVFYKVGHHLSYNGTALEKGIMMMESPELAAMATLDRNRIANAWKTTMPNKFLLQELIRRTQGKFFIMDEFEIEGGPAAQMNPNTLGKTVYTAGTGGDGKKVLYKQYTVRNL